MSRLDFAPDQKEIRRTEAGRGAFAFAPKPGVPVSFGALRRAIDKAGFDLHSAEAVVIGTLTLDGRQWSLVADLTGQRFALGGKNLAKALAGAAPGALVEVTAGWKTAGDGGDALEVLSPRTIKAQEAGPPQPAAPPGPGHNFQRPKAITTMAGTTTGFAQKVENVCIGCVSAL